MIKNFTFVCTVLTYKHNVIDIPNTPQNIKKILRFTKIENNFYYDSLF